jgi:hypothetical protein
MKKREGFEDKGEGRRDVGDREERTGGEGCEKKWGSIVGEGRMG